ncbi:MAG TPA: AAA family ATPase [Alphaproteobacteria bacterium]|nr:AAA family ATPase [Alphaproteobacteria bacterium]
MYNDFYELQREPFHVTPDPDFLFPSPAHKEALAAIIYGIEQRKGFVAITGEVGVGKTTILRSYLDFADRQNLKLIYVYNSDLSFDELVTMLLQELGVEERPPSTFQAVSRLHEALIDVYRQNQTVVLIIDEAQNMPVDTLESLRMLSNLETVTEKLIQIMLIGQPEFDELLQQHRLRQLRQRIAIHARIGPLNFEDSIAYLEHRLAKVALGTKPVFTKNALKLIAEASQGIPRNLNIISDNALITGYGYQQRPVNTRIVKEVLADRGFTTAPAAVEPVLKRGRGLWIGTGTAAAAAVAAIVAVLALRPELMPSEARREAEQQQAATAQPAPAPAPQVASRSADAPASRSAEAQSGTAREPASPTPPSRPATPQPQVVERAPAPPPEPPRAPPAPPVAERTPAPPPAPPQAAPGPPKPAEVARAEPPRSEARQPERPTVVTPPPSVRSPPATVRPSPPPAAAPQLAPSAPQAAEVARAQPSPPRENSMPPAPPAASVGPAPARPAPPSPQTTEPPRTTRSGSTETASAEPRPQQPATTARRTPPPIPLAAPPSRPATTPEPAPVTRSPSTGAPGPLIAAVPSPAAPPSLPPSVMLPSASGSGIAAGSTSEDTESLVARPLATLPPPTTQTVRAVRAGDSLWTMAEEVYGFVSPSVLRRVQDANPQIRNINVLAPGQEVVFPRVQETPFGRGTTLSDSLSSTGRN